MRLAQLAALMSLGLVSILVSTSCSALGQATPAAGAARQRPATVVAVATAKVGQIANVLTYSGTIQPRNQVNIVPKVSGRVQKINVDVGSDVKAGDVLAELDHDTLDAQVKQAEANVSAAQARLDLLKIGPTNADMQAAQDAVATAQARLVKAQSDLDHLTNPTQDEKTAAKAAADKAAAALQKAQADYDKVAYRPDVGSLPQATTLQQATIDYQAALAAYNTKVSPRPQDVAAAQAAVTSAQADVSTAQAKLDQLKQYPSQTDLMNQKAAQGALDQAKAALEVAKAQRADAIIVAPFDGVISQKFLSPGALASPSTSVVSLVTRDVQVTLSIEEARIGQLREGQPVVLSVPAYPDQTFPAKVTNVSPTADSKSHTFAIEVAPDQQDGKLKPGMFANVRITTQQKDNAVLVPKDAVTQVSSKNVVYVVSDGQAHIREVSLGIQDGDNIEIVSGLSAGDQVVTAGFSSLSDGSPVRIAGPQGQQEQQGQPGQRQGPQGKPGNPEGNAQSKDQAKPQGSGANQ